MKVVAVKTFNDLKAGCLRKAGDVFVVSKERFAEVDAKLPGYLKAVEEKPKAEDVSAE